MSVLICALPDPIHYLFRRAVAYFNTASLMSCWGWQLGLSGVRDRFGIFGTVTRIRKLSLLLVMMLRIPNTWHRGRGFGEALIALEAGAGSGRRLPPRPRVRWGGDCARGQGVRRDGDCAQGQWVGQDRDCARGQGVKHRFYSFLPLFALLIWVSKFMVPNTMLHIFIYSVINS